MMQEAPGHRQTARLTGGTREVDDEQAHLSAVFARIGLRLPCAATNWTNSPRRSRPREGFHPIGPRSRARRRPERCLHHFVSHPAKEEGVGLVEVLDRVTMQFFVCGYCTMVTAPVQCDVDGIPKGSHYARLPPLNVTKPILGSCSSDTYL